MKFEDFISRFEKRKKTQLGFMVRCPSHDDSEKSPSLHACPARDGGIILKCFAGCGTPQVVAALGLTMRDLFAGEQARHFTPPPAKIESKKATGPEEKPVIEKIYSYKDVNGCELYQAIRMKPKSFRQRHTEDSQR